MMMGRNHNGRGRAAEATNLVGCSIVLLVLLLSSLAMTTVSAFSSSFLSPPSSSTPFVARYSPNQENRFQNGSPSALSMSSAPVNGGPPPSQTAADRSSRKNPIEQLSPEAVEAVKAGHDVGNEIGAPELTVELLFAGAVRHPERARQTLERYGIQFDEVKRAAVAAMKKRSDVTLSQDGEGGGEKKEALPFANESRLLLSKACSIAESMESATARSEHLLLALLGYNNGKKIEDAPVVKVLASMQSLGNSRSSTREGRNFRVYDFCEDLVNSLPNTPYDENNVSETTVVIGGGDSKTNTLSEVGVDMTQLALEGKYDAVYGRNKELRTILRTLGRRRKNNPCLIGDPGVGKTAVAEALAQVLAEPLAKALEEQERLDNMQSVNPMIKQIQNPFRMKKEREEQENGEGGESSAPTNVEDVLGYELPKCPAALEGFRLVSVELASLVAGTSNRGDFEKKVKNIVEEASNSNTILFIDEIHNIVGAGGGGDGAMNAANLLKPSLARGLRVLGSTTTPEYRRYIEKDGALERRFQPLTIEEPTVEETLDILAAIFPKYEEYHGVQYTSKALMAAAKLSDRYIGDRFLPDKAIDLLDEAGSMVKMADPDEGEENFYVTEDAIQAVVSEMSGIPLGKLDTGEKSRLRNLEVAMQGRIKGQDQAVRVVAKSIRRARSGMRDGKRPVASLLFCGPTGVGKTELCKALAETYYGQEKDMIRIDMSEYMDRFSTSRLVGAPPGYVGYEEGGQLTEAVRRNPHSVVLFDELEKAHEDVLNVLLQIMDEGTLTDGKGRKVNFKNTIFVMTSNIGGKQILDAAKQEGLIPDTAADQAQVNSDVVQAALEEAMRPELLNRIDEIVVFNPLSYENLRDIATNLVSDAVKRAAADLDIRLQVSDNIPEMITREALKSASLYGARPIRRAVQRFVEDTMAEVIIDEFVSEGDEVRIGLKDPNGDKRLVKITNLSSNDSVEIAVDEDAGVSASLSDQASFGDLPPLGEPPKPENDSFQ